MDTLIEAAGRASSRIPGLSVAIAGDGRDRRRLERLAAASTVPVKLLGELTDAELSEFYACSDCFALCSRSRWAGLEQEGFGAVLVEAASSGVPCITIEGGGVSEAVVDGETGFVVRPALKARTGRFAPSRGRAVEADGVSEALVQVLTDPALARRMGEAGRRRAERDLSYDVLALRLAEALQQLAAPAGEAPRQLGHRSPDAGA
jgi:phosphatidylinositol alpha-1,6-mannosyltransferase